MSRYRRPTDLARAILTDATVIASLIDDALVKIDNEMNGWPTQTPGASPATPLGAQPCPHPDCTNTRPCTDHDRTEAGVALTATERFAAQNDPALKAHTELTEALRIVAHHAADAARICTRWGLAGVTSASVATKLANIDSNIWCTNCARNGHSTSRLPDRTECKFCSDFRREGACGIPNPNHLDAPKDLIDTHKTRRINSADVKRIMERHHGPRWNLKGKKKAA